MLRWPLISQRLTRTCWFVAGASLSSFVGQLIYTYLDLDGSRAEHGAIRSLQDGLLIEALFIITASIAMLVNLVFIGNWRRPRCVRAVLAFFYAGLMQGLLTWAFALKNLVPVEAVQDDFGYTAISIAVVFPFLASEFLLHGCLPEEPGFPVGDAKRDIPP